MGRLTKVRCDRTIGMLCLATLAACGGGGGNGAGSSGGGGGTGDPAGLGANTLEVIASEPAAGSVQVAVDAALRVTVDGRLHPASVAPDRASLHDLTRREDHPGALVLEGEGDGLRFVPGTPLRPDTHYRLTLDALLCAEDGRLLEHDRSLEFTTIDTRAPQVTHVDGPVQSLLAQGVPMTVHFDEALSTATFDGVGAVRILDEHDGVWPTRWELQGPSLVVRPLLDLPGDGRYRLELTAAVDRFGNAAPSGTSHEFLTAVDLDPPQVIRTWPQTGYPLSPDVQPRITFDESLDLATLPFGSVRAWSEGGEQVDIDLAPSADQRTLTLIPLQPLPSGAVTIQLPAGPGLLADHSGNHGWFQQSLQLTIGDDRTAPRMLRSTPAHEGGLDLDDGVIALDFDEDLDPGSLSDGPATLRPVDAPLRETPLRTPRLLAGDRLVLEPASALEPLTEYELVLHRGSRALTDRAGNPLAAEERLRFTTGSAFPHLEARTWPQDGSTEVPRNALLAVRFAQPLDPASLHAGTTQLVLLRSDLVEIEVAHTASLDQDAHRLRVTPNAPLEADQRYELRLPAGAAGLRGTDGAVLAGGLQLAFRTGIAADQTSPTASLTIDAIEEARNGDLAVGPHGFVVDVGGQDGFGAGIDWSSTELTLRGPSGAEIPPGTASRLAVASDRGFSLVVPASHALDTGRYTAEATVTDLAGNRSHTASMGFEVVTPTAGRLPFERTQVVWVRFDLDRDNSGVADFDEDLLRLGLTAAGDPLGTNQRIRDLAADGVLRRVRSLYGREADGSRPASGADTVGIVFTDREPAGLPAMQIACGGFDPEGRPGRGYGDASSGVLGRAWFDRNNGAFDQHATASAPGLGVFPAEMFLFEVGIHRTVYPSFVTTFARGFLPFCEPMGGTPVGLGPHDAAALDPDFDPATASTTARARREAILGAADDWATVVGTILAHEVGHAVGLTAPGQDAASLHGDDSLHNAHAGVTDVMAPSLGYDSMVGLGYQFRDLNLAYLRQHVLLR